MPTPMPQRCANEKLPNVSKTSPPYKPIEPFDVLSNRLGLMLESIVKLDANENPYGPSPLALHALEEIPFPNIYPDPESRALRKGLSEFTGVPGRISAGRGRRG